MNRVLLCLMTAGVCAAQVANEANSGYRTTEGRARMQGMLGGRDRDARQKPRELIQALGIRPGMTVVDMGTGIGYMLPYLSAAVGPAGKVIGQDIYPDFLDKAKEKAKRENLGNVAFVQGTDKNASLPENSADMIIALDAYHHFDFPEKMLAGVRQALKREGYFAVVDYYKRRGAMGAPDSDRALTHIRLDAADMIKEVESNGFRVHSLTPFIQGVQYIAVFEKKPAN